MSELIIIILRGGVYNFFTNGLRGVEICYIVNALLLIKSYSAGNYTPYELFKKNIKSLLPMYYIFVLLYILVRTSFGEKFSKGTVVSALFFFNFVNPYWSNKLGGTLFYSCLVVSWMIYLVCFKYIKNLKASLVFGGIVLFFTLYYMPFHLSNEENINYLYRCISSFSVGPVIWYIVTSEKYKKLLFPQMEKLIITGFMCFIIWFDFFYGFMSMFDFYGIIMILIIINYNDPCVILNNVILNYLGKRIFPIFCSHILVYTILDRYIKIGNFWFVMTVIFTLILSETAYQVDLFFKRKSRC
ncbi:hypothetical protein [Clostridium sp. TF11-13AC]|uniref:hypothetical protein n=1 Tax=Clostridium sp. TF11-13AC TaxID=2293053 RepID=UPI0011C214EB|nr:hypothetical protein [Clostridium sp. TF11-13AC]